MALHPWWTDGSVLRLRLAGSTTRHPVPLDKMAESGDHSNRDAEAPLRQPLVAIILAIVWLTLVRLIERSDLSGASRSGLTH